MADSALTMLDIDAVCRHTLTTRGKSRLVSAQRKLWNCVPTHTVETKRLFLLERRMITQAHLKTLLHYNEDTGIFTWIRKPFRSKVIVGSIAGSKQKKGTRIKIERRTYTAHKLAWLYVYGEWPLCDVIDHINRNPWDNRIVNLRQATYTQNQANRIGKNGRVLPKGVAMVPNGKFVAVIKINGQKKHIGTFDDISSASAAYYAAAKDAFGEYARQY